jgi:hypothetical protein
MPTLLPIAHEPNPSSAAMTRLLVLPPFSAIKLGYQA